MPAVNDNDRRKVKRSSLVPYIELLRIAGLVSIDFICIGDRIVKC